MTQNGDYMYIYVEREEKDVGSKSYLVSTMIVYTGFKIITGYFM